ncbi:hypothetical protein H1D32_24325 [Anaerobacillus sp. CMMVII]|uniref:hypothetical protein n=1 Tax=Anaerobacillus sp. CMMVII TaxID=2755588 RepID=UPI0021B7922B|nr:hypothetical protein [Anaerobacillus sp. CMMVII]MCT8140523.1 hypothetical protein [Anaerobacillus sp. CMMVII]
MLELFKRKKKFWVNVDIPTKMFTVHTNCTYENKKSETDYKGINRIKRDGGWLNFSSIKEIESFYSENYETFFYKKHC